MVITRARDIDFEHIEQFCVGVLPVKNSKEM